MRMSRRALIGIGLGMSQLGLLERFGLLGRSRAATPAEGPTKLLVLYLQGGCRQWYQWWGNPPEDVARAVPPPGGFLGEPTFFTAEHLVELGSGDGYTP